MKKNPFYIVTPPYDESSLHARILNNLAHYLNSEGEQAFLFPFPLTLKGDRKWPAFCRFPQENWGNPELNVKLLTQDIIDLHFNEGLVPVCIVPEIFGDPLDSPYLIKYIIDYPDEKIKKCKKSQNFTLSYSRVISDYIGSNEVLTIPYIDTEFFYNKFNNTRSKIGYFSTDPITPAEMEKYGIQSTDIEIHNLDKYQRRKIFWDLEKFYCFADTPFSIEAALCGCEVIYVMNGNFRSIYPTLMNELKLNKQTGNIFTNSVKGEKLKIQLDLLEISAREYTKKLALYARSQTRNSNYTKPILLPYNGKIVFIESNKNKLQWEKKFENKLQEKQSKTLYLEKISIYRKLRIFVINWLLPPRIAQLLIRIYKRILNKK